MRLADVVAAWRVADPKHIHPTREHESETAYWESGKQQALHVVSLVDEGATVLDFGCGDGRIALPMAHFGLVVFAMDASPAMLDRLRDHDPDSSVFSVIQSDGMHLSEHFLDYFDAVVCRAVLIHHSHKDVAVLVKNLAACLKSDGLFIADWPVGVHHERRDWIDVTTWDYDHRAKVAAAAGLELVSEGQPKVRPSVWRKHG